MVTGQSAMGEKNAQAPVTLPSRHKPRSAAASASGWGGGAAKSVSCGDGGDTLKTVPYEFGVLYSRRPTLVRAPRKRFWPL